MIVSEITESEKMQKYLEDISWNYLNIFSMNVLTNQQII